MFQFPHSLPHTVLKTQTHTSMTTATLKHQNQGTKDDEQLEKATQWLEASTDKNIFCSFVQPILEFPACSWRNYYVSTNPMLGLYNN